MFEHEHVFSLDILKGEILWPKNFHMWCCPPKGIYEKLSQDFCFLTAVKSCWLQCFCLVQKKKKKWSFILKLDPRVNLKIMPSVCCKSTHSIWPAGTHLLCVCPTRLLMVAYVWCLWLKRRVCWDVMYSISKEIRHPSASQMTRGVIRTVTGWADIVKSQLSGMSHNLEVFITGGFSHNHAQVPGPAVSSEAK